MAGAEKPNARRSVSTRATVREGGIQRREGRRRRVEGRLTLCPFPPPTIRLVAALLLHRSAATSDTPEMVNPPPPSFCLSIAPPPFLLHHSLFSSKLCFASTIRQFDLLTVSVTDLAIGGPLTLNLRFRAKIRTILSRHPTRSILPLRFSSSSVYLVFVSLSRAPFRERSERG